MSLAHGFYYNSHARFLFCSLSEEKLNSLRAALVATGLPPERLVALDKTALATRAALVHEP